MNSRTLAITLSLAIGIPVGILADDDTSSRPAALGSARILPKTYAFDTSRFRIGAYYLFGYALDEEHIRDVRDCGCDWVYGLVAGPERAREAMGLFDKYGLSAIIRYWPVSSPKRRGKFHEDCPLEKLDAVVAEQDKHHYEDFPSFQGCYSCDEPGAMEFEHYGKVVRRELELKPRLLPYLNLYPSYATVYQDSADSARSQLGAKTYKEYIDLYCKYIPLDYISLDFYLYAPPNDSLLPKYYNNLQVVGDACRATGRDFWFIGQVNSTESKRWTSTNQLRFQAFSTMAYGCVNLNWACYCAGWWTNQVLTKTGEKTQQYEKLKQVNGEVRMIAPKYMRYRNVGTDYVGFGAQSKALSLVVEKQPVAGVDFGGIECLKAEDGRELLVGSMDPRTADVKSHALFVCAADDPFDKAPTTRKVVFRTKSPRVIAFGTNGVVPVVATSDGAYSFSIVSSSAVLLVVE